MIVNGWPKTELPLHAGRDRLRCKKGMSDASKGAHLANANKQEHIRHVNTLLGLHVPILTTPLELIGEPEEDE